MDLTTWIIIGSIIAAVLLFKHLTRVSPVTAREWLAKGALVIDVRTEAEFQERNLPGAINIPLDRLGNEIARHAASKEQPLLLHCRSGARSGRGTSVLKQMGYQNVYNLGSFGSAGKALAEQRKLGGKS